MESLASCFSSMAADAGESGASVSHDAASGMDGLECLL